MLFRSSLVKDVAARFDLKPPHVSDPEISMQVSCAKLFSTEMVGRVADRGVQIHGGAGYMDEYRISRMYTDARIQRIYGGTTEIMKDLIARRLGT